MKIFRGTLPLDPVGAGLQLPAVSCAYGDLIRVLTHIHGASYVGMALLSYKSGYNMLCMCMYLKGNFLGYQVSWG